MRDFSPTQEAEVHSQQLSAVLIEQPSKSALPSIAVSGHSDAFPSKSVLMRVYCSRVQKGVPGQVPLDLICYEQMSRGGVGIHANV